MRLGPLDAVSSAGTDGVRRGIKSFYNQQMTGSMRERLAAILNAPLDPRSAVVYFIVELRKSLEHLDGQYDVLGFFSDGALHAKLIQTISGGWIVVGGVSPRTPKAAITKRSVCSAIYSTPFSYRDAGLGFLRGRKSDVVGRIFFWAVPARIA